MNSSSDMILYSSLKKALSYQDYGELKLYEYYSKQKGKALLDKTFLETCLRLNLTANFFRDLSSIKFNTKVLEFSDGITQFLLQ